MSETETLPGDIDVQQLAPQGSGDVLLTPDTHVLCIHRGRNAIDAAGLLVRMAGMPKRRAGDLDAAPGVRDPQFAYEGDYRDTFDSKHYVIAPGYFTAPLGAARHFKRRAVVPGSRNPETNSEASFLAIIGVALPSTTGFRIVKRVDDAEEWEPFSDEECAEYGMAVEALDRRHMVDPIVPASELKVVSTTGALSGAGETTRTSRISGNQSIGGKTGRGKGTRIEADPGVLTPIDPQDNDTLRQIAADRVAAANEQGRG